MRQLALGLVALVCGLVLPGQAGGEIRLREVASEWGIDFRHHHGGSGERFMVETVVGGTVLLDFDGDGDEDIFFIDGGWLPGYEGEEPRSRLFRNDGAGRFVDFSDSSGIVVAAYGCGGAAADYDGDGDLDLYVTAFGSNQLLRNDGDGTFSDVTEKAGVGASEWSTAAAFADTDRDGDVDLYVANYVDFTLDRHKFCGDRERGLQGYCHPSAYEGVADYFFRNRGDGAFVDATQEVGLAVPGEAGLGAAFSDVDLDGWPDLYVANDADPNFLFRNRGDGSFDDLSLLSGTAYGEVGKAEGSMGVDFGDVDGDGDPDLVVANFEFEANALYQNAGGRIFIDGRFPSGIAEPSLLDLAFGVVLVDLDHDADLDLVIANGHILDNASEFDPSSRYAQENRVFGNLGDGRFREVRGHGLDSVRVSRGLASGDLDGDGDADLVIVNSNDRAEVYENLLEPVARGWLQVDVWRQRGDRFGVGSRLEVEADGRRQVREVRTGASYLSQSSLTAHFGLRGARRVAVLRVFFSDGAVHRYVDLPANRRLRLTDE